MEYIFAPVGPEGTPISNDVVIHTERSERMSAPQIVAFHWAEVAISQEEGDAVTRIVRDVWGVARVPPWVPAESAYGSVWRWLQKFH